MKKFIFILFLLMSQVTFGDIISGVVAGSIAGDQARAAIRQAAEANAAKNNNNISGQVSLEYIWPHIISCSCFSPSEKYNALGLPKFLGGYHYGNCAFRNVYFSTWTKVIPTEDYDFRRLYNSQTKLKRILYIYSLKDNPSLKYVRWIKVYMYRDMYNEQIQRFENTYFE